MEEPAGGWAVVVRDAAACSPAYLEQHARGCRQLCKGLVNRAHPPEVLPGWGGAVDLCKPECILQPVFSCQESS